jgi:nicotinate-nucleotide adenylyltransferase
MSKSLPHTRRTPLRLGIYGGTFDPIHLGHLILAQDVREQLHLDAVLFVPCGQSPHKLGNPPSPAKHRLAMLRATLRDWPHFWLSRCEIDRPGPSYAIDTVGEIQAAFPRAQLFWIIGADQLPKLKTWKDYKGLHRKVTFVVMDREKTPRRPLAGFIRLPQARRVDISASEIRARAMRKLPINHLVTAPVAAYIERTHLYH